MSGRDAVHALTVDEQRVLPGREYRYPRQPETGLRFRLTSLPIVEADLSSRLPISRPAGRVQAPSMIPPILHRTEAICAVLRLLSGNRRSAR